MGIDIYLGGYDAYKARTAEAHKQFDMAVKLRDGFPRDSAESKVAQGLVELASNEMWAGKHGYIRSSYNGGGLFNVLDRIFGIESGGLLFPGNWEEDLEIDWDKFLGAVRTLQGIAACLKHGDPLPVRLEELETVPNETRKHGEAFGKSVLEALSGIGLDVRSGGEDQPGFFTEDDYGWYITEGLRDLREFGELGKKEQEAGKDTKVHISY